LIWLGEFPVPEPAKPRCRRKREIFGDPYVVAVSSGIQKNAGAAGIDGKTLDLVFLRNFK
jgi:hypothetical protein